MDWLSEWDPYPMSFSGTEIVDPPAQGEQFTAWLILAVIALTVVVIWYRMGVFRHAFWCATARREVEVHLARGCVRSCSAFENPAAIACDRRCLDRSFRMQWPPALPVLAGAQRFRGA